MQNYMKFEALRRLGQLPDPVQTPLPGQVANNAGGMSWQVDDWTRLYRFLILGAANGTYYVGQRDLLAQNLSAITNLLDRGEGMKIVDAVVDISTKGRGASNDPALLVLAACASCDSHGKVKRELSVERSYKIHRKNHAAWFEKFPEENIVHTRIKNGREETLVRHGDTIHRTIKVASGTFVEEDHPDDVAIRRYAMSQLPKVARTGTHLLHFVQFARKFRGWGPTLRYPIQRWYLDMPEKKLAEQVLKYQSRDGYAQRDVLRLAHPKAETSTYNTIFHWVTQGWPGVGDEPHPDPALRTIWAFEKAKHADEQEANSLVTRYRLTRESVPTHFLSSKLVWQSLLHNMPAEAMEVIVRNLGNMSRLGVLAAGNEATQYVTQLLTDPLSVQKSKLHPIKILAALTQYDMGHGDSGGFRGKAQQTWPVLREIVSALDKAFRLAFVNVEATGKKILLAIDVSGSMTNSRCHGLKNLTLHQAAAAMAVVLAGVEGTRNITTIAVDTRIYPFSITGDMSLSALANQLDHFGRGGTNLGLIIEYALSKNLYFDCIVVLTDSETWQGGHVSTILEQYRQCINREVRIINVQMTATHVTNNNPNDKRALEVAGFDTSVPEVISSFIRGEI